MSESVITWIAAWLTKRQPGEEITLSPDTDLYESGLLDSLGVIELIEALEEHFDMQLSDDQMQAGLTKLGDFEKAFNRT